VVTVPAFADTVPIVLPVIASPATTSQPDLTDSRLPTGQASAADLVKVSESGPKAVPWRRQDPQPNESIPANLADIEPRVTSVPAAVVVGGLLMASLGISQRIRRGRSARSR
jgi:hypothetical protein